MVLVTHYQRLLDYIVPDFVHVLLDGRIVKSGGKELALELEKKGYEWLRGPGGLAMTTAAAPTFPTRGRALARGVRVLPRRPALRRAGVAPHPAHDGHGPLRGARASPPPASRTGGTRTWPPSRGPSSIARRPAPASPASPCSTPSTSVTPSRGASSCSSTAASPRSSRPGERRRTACTSAASAKRSTVSPSSSSPTSTARPAATGRPFAALNTALPRATAPSSPCPRARCSTEPIHLVFLSAPGDRATASHPRVLVVGGQNEPGHDRRELWRDRRRGVPHQRRHRDRRSRTARSSITTALQRETSRAFHVGTLCATPGPRQRVFAFARDLAAAASLAPRGHHARSSRARAASACSTASSWSADTQHLDTHTWIDHAQPHCTSRELYKGVARRQGARRVRRPILVRPGAQKTDAKQTQQEPAPLPGSARGQPAPARDPRRRREVQTRLDHRPARPPSRSSTCARAASGKRRRGPARLRVRQRRRASGSKRRSRCARA